MFALATPVQFGSGWVFYKEALSGLRHRKLGMAAMVVLGTTVAWLLAVFLNPFVCPRTFGEIQQNEDCAQKQTFNQQKRGFRRYDSGEHVISMELLYSLRFTEHVAGNSDLSHQRLRFSSNRFCNQFCVHI